MPFFRFHFVEASKLADVSREMTDKIQRLVACPRENIVLEVIHSTFVEDGCVKDRNYWPFVEVDYFERPRNIQTKVAQIIFEYLQKAGYPYSDIYFSYMKPENYYENGKELG